MSGISKQIGIDNENSPISILVTSWKKRKKPVPGSWMDHLRTLVQAENELLLHCSPTKGLPQNTGGKTKSYTAQFEKCTSLTTLCGEKSGSMDPWMVANGLDG